MFASLWICSLRAAGGRPGGVFFFSGDTRTNRAYMPWFNGPRSRGAAELTNGWSRVVASSMKLGT